VRVSIDESRFRNLFGEATDGSEIESIMLRMIDKPKYSSWIFNFFIFGGVGRYPK